MSDIADGTSAFAAKAPVRRALLPLLVLAGLTSMVITIGLGSVGIPPGTVLDIIRETLLPGSVVPSWNKGQYHIVVDLRIPRVILGACCGAGLAAVGAVLQSLTRNPLADPYLFGVSSGASVGAVAVILYTGSVVGMATLPLAAFAGALGAMALVFYLAREAGGFANERLVLTGVAVHFVLMAATNAMIFKATDRGAEGALFWMLGSYANARWHLLPIPALAIAAGLAWILYRARALDALSLGDEGAHTLGIAVKRLRLEMFVVTALLTGVLVSAAGAVGFIGLIIPHCARWIAGADMRRTVPIAALVGAIFSIWVDAGARLLLAPLELPLGVVTAAFGGLFFIIILKRRQGR